MYDLQYTIIFDVPVTKGRKWYSLKKDLLAFITGMSKWDYWCEGK